jgi:hypothetical protein
MPQTIKHTLDGTPYIVGDTQGLVVPKPCRFMRSQSNGGNAIGTAWVILSPGTVLEGEDWRQGNNVVVPKDGLYTIKMALKPGAAQPDIAANNYLRIGNSTSGIGIASRVVSKAYYATVMLEGSLLCKAGDVLIIQCAVESSGSAFNFPAFEFNITLVEQSTPEFVVNKGALVPNPVQNGVVFDENGRMFLARGNQQTKRIICSGSGSADSYYKIIGKDPARGIDVSGRIYGYSSGASQLIHHGIWDFMVFTPGGASVAAYINKALGGATMTIGKDADGNVWFRNNGQYLAFNVEIHGLYQNYVTFENEAGALTKETTPPAGWTELASA